MTGSNCGKRIMLSFSDLNSRINEFALAYSPICMHHLSPLAIYWTLFLHEKAFLLSNFVDHTQRVSATPCHQPWIVKFFVVAWDVCGLVTASHSNELAVVFQLSNEEMFWVVTEVCSEPNIGRRARIIKHFIQIASTLPFDFLFTLSLTDIVAVWQFFLQKKSSVIERKIVLFQFWYVDVQAGSRCGSRCAMLRSSCRGQTHGQMDGQMDKSVRQ